MIPDGRFEMMPEGVKNKVGVDASLHLNVQ